MEEFSIVINAGEPRTIEEFVLEDLRPDLVDFIPLREEAVPTDIEEVAFVIHRARQSANRVVRLQDNSRYLVLGKFVGSGEAGGARTNNHNPLLQRARIGHFFSADSQCRISCQQSTSQILADKPIETKWVIQGSQSAYRKAGMEMEEYFCFAAILYYIAAIPALARSWTQMRIPG
jgi:hypothetical protein